MPDEDSKKQQSEPAGKNGTDKTKRSSFGVFGWLITIAIIVAGAVGGFALAQLVIRTGPQTANAQEQSKADEFLASAENRKNEPWQYKDLPPVIGNLDEPGVTRYLRMSIILLMSPEMDQVKGTEYLAQKHEILIDFVGGYIRGLTLERVRGQKAATRMKREITEGFNELLFPDSKPFVQTILFKEFAVQ